jgi:phage terminase large subunit GpA-like protein
MSDGLSPLNQYEDCENQKRRFTFRCDRCGKIVELDFVEPKEIAEVMEELLFFECHCVENGLSRLLTS